MEPVVHQYIVEQRTNFQSSSASQQQFVSMDHLGPTQAIEQE
jgi:hypothetical protein